MEYSTIFTICIGCLMIGASQAAYDYITGDLSPQGVPIDALSLQAPQFDEMLTYGTAESGDAMQVIENMNKNISDGIERCFRDGDIPIPCNESPAARRKRNALRDRGMRWPGGVVPYTIDYRYDSGTVRRIESAFARYHATTCIRFVQRTTEDRYVRIFPGNGCYSLVGRQARGPQQLSLGTGCTTNLGTIIHELMHAIGFQHEQTRADRDDFVYIYFNNIIRGLEYNFDKYDNNFIDNLGTRYDYFSVMHYHMTAFSTNGQPTIVAREPSIRLDYRSDFSATDINKINRYYECDGTTDEVNPPRPENCVDNNQYCMAWANAGHCDRNPSWMHANCMLSCNICPTEPTTGTGDNNCMDTHETCPTWASDGECQNNPTWMLVNCPVSCNSCDDTTTPTPANCEDTNENCAAWASAGECQINPSWMLPNCPVSCDSCDNPAEVCMDKNDYCDVWSRAGECTNNPSYMLENCPRSCGQCGGNTLMNECEDYHENCAAWAANDHCRLNPGYMNYECRKSCSLCTASSPLELNPQVTCNDTTGFCGIYKERGMCESEPKYMGLACPFTCGMCPEQLSTDGGAAARWSLTGWLAVLLAAFIVRGLVL